jgi:P27 family predicted phage terminase small subunit
MGRRGPTPTPIAILKKKGTENVTRIKEKGMPEDLAIEFIHNSFPTAPERLNEAASEIWTTQLMEAQKLYGYISFLDLRLFEMYCWVHGELEDLKTEFLDRTYKDNNGVIRLNPLYTERRRLVDTFTKLSREFGFSPSARTGINLVQRKEEFKDEFEEGL